MRELFGPIAPSVLEIEAKTGKNRPETRQAHLRILAERWEDIQEIIREELPPRSRILALMKRVRMPLYPEDLGLTLQDTRDALLGSREIRDKYLTSSLLWDLGLLEEAADRLPEALARE